METKEGLSRVLIGVADVQTGKERILTHIDNRGCYGVRWSPIGESIAISESPLTGNVSSQTSISLIDVESGTLRRLNPSTFGGPFTAVEWSPDGKKLLVGQSEEILARASGDPGQLMEIDIESGTVRPLFWAMIRLPTSGWAFSALAVIPGKKVILDEAIVHAELLEVGWGQPHDTVPPRILTRGLGIDRQPAYSHEGDKVIFSSNRSGNVDLWVVDRSRESILQFTDDPADDWDPAFTPDGQHVLWSSNRGGNMEIWMAGVDGTNTTQISRDGVDAENPTMTPDGEWIVYASGNDEKLGLWKVRPDGSDATMLAAGSLLLPEVSPDGRYALFLALRGFNGVVQVVEIATGELTQFEIVLTSSWRHQNVVLGRSRWSHDGSMIVFIGEDENNRTGVYGQKFVLGEDTSDTRIPLAGFSKNFSTESLSVSPDGKHVAISAVFEQRAIKIADRVKLTGWE
jgi:Tol biopolymer transport system component